MATIGLISLVTNQRISNTRALKSNLAYSMQYIEFLEKELSELRLTSVLYVMIVKTYVIIGMSVLEGLFSNIIKSRGWWKMDDLESVGVITANEKNFSGNKFVVRTELLQKTTPYYTQKNLDDFIKILSKHHDALSVDHLVYPALGRLRSLRNRIHLQMNSTETDHDYNAFNYMVKREMGRILYEILTLLASGEKGHSGSGEKGQLVVG